MRKNNLKISVALIILVINISLMVSLTTGINKIKAQNDMWNDLRTQNYELEKENKGLLNDLNDKIKDIDTFVFTIQELNEELGK